MGSETTSSNGEPGTEEAEAFVDALNHSAERVQTLWFSFLTFMLYLAVATGTTTHRMLFLESPLNLPVLNIPLPLLAFYILTPFIFVVFHFYMLLNLVLLARTARSFGDALVRAFPEDGDARETFRMRIENTLFVQLLVGGRLEREGLNAKLLSAMALITLVIAPVALLLYLQIKFLPYHSEAITWLHRGLLALGLALVWTLWPGYRTQGGERLWPQRSWWLVPAAALSAAALTYALALATFPDEQMYMGTNWLHGPTVKDPGRLESSRIPSKWNHWIMPVNTLDLHGEGLIDDEKLACFEKTKSSTNAERWEPTFSLVGRDLTGANLREADIRHVDFSDATLNRANLSDAWAKNARFNRAQLCGALLLLAQLQGASLFNAQLQGTQLQNAQLQAASLDRAQLQGASLDGARLQGAELGRAGLEGTSLGYAQLQGALLNGARLQAAWLSYAQLQGASLHYAQLQGAELVSAQLQGASFVEACVWRADARQADWEDTRVTRPQTGPKGDKCEWTAASFAELKQLITAEVPEGASKFAMYRIEHRLDPTKALEGEKEMAEIWAARERETPAPEVYEKSVAELWRKTGCGADGAPYVLEALTIRLSIPAATPFHYQSDAANHYQSDAAKALAAAFLDEAHCPGAHGLSEADKAKLKEIAGPAAPPAPKP